MKRVREPRRLELAQLPTPLISLNHLADQLGVERILMKRDDLTGFEASGNKIRKLEYVVADALAGEADTLVTHGGVQSNHCRATAAIGARLGLRVRLLLRSEDPHPPLEGNLLLDRLFGAKVTFHTLTEFQENSDGLIDTVMDAERAAGGTPYFFPVGASIPLGCWGYIRCIHELTQELNPDEPVDIFCATGSGGTQVGLMLGKALFECDNWRIIGVPVCDSVEFFRRDLRRLERQMVAEYGLQIDAEQTPIELLDGFIGPGYAIPYDEDWQAIFLLAQQEGILLDPTYTGKARAGMISSIRRGRLRENATPLFLHTGGAFGLMTHQTAEAQIANPR